jgi:hypothetical protein
MRGRHDEEVDSHDLTRGSVRTFAKSLTADVAVAAYTVDWLAETPHFSSSS